MRIEFLKTVKLGRSPAAPHGEMVESGDIRDVIPSLAAAMVQKGLAKEASPVPKPAPSLSPTVDLRSMKKSELLAMARSMDLEIPRWPSKAKLLELLAGA